MVHESRVFSEGEATGPWPLSLPASLRVKKTSVLRPPVLVFVPVIFPKSTSRYAGLRKATYTD